MNTEGLGPPYPTLDRFSAPTVREKIFPTPRSFLTAGGACLTPGDGKQAAVFLDGHLSSIHAHLYRAQVSLVAARVSRGIVNQETSAERCVFL